MVVTLGVQKRSGGHKELEQTLQRHLDGAVALIRLLAL